MIEIRIDEKACVGCELCVDDCPTEVFTFDSEKKIPIVSKKDDCIECLTCAYVCPAAAVEYSNAYICPDFYRDVEILKMAEGIL